LRTSPGVHLSPSAQSPPRHIDPLFPPVSRRVREQRASCWQLQDSRRGCHCRCLYCRLRWQRQRRRRPRPPRRLRHPLHRCRPPPPALRKARGRRAPSRMPPSRRRPYRPPARRPMRGPRRRPRSGREAPETRPHPPRPTPQRRADVSPAKVECPRAAGAEMKAARRATAAAAAAAARGSRSKRTVGEARHGSTCCRGCGGGAAATGAEGRRRCGSRRVGPPCRPRKRSSPGKSSIAACTPSSAFRKKKRRRGRGDARSASRPTTAVRRPASTYEAAAVAAVSTQSPHPERLELPTTKDKLVWN